MIETVSFGNARTTPHPEGVGQRNIDHHLAAHGAIVTRLNLQQGIKIRLRQVGDHIDHARCGVAAIEGSLRAAQDLDAVHV